MLTTGSPTRSGRQKPKQWGVSLEIVSAAPCFFVRVCGPSTSKQHPHSKKFALLICSLLTHCSALRPSVSPQYYTQLTSCAIRGARCCGIGHRSPPGGSWGVTGVGWVCSGSPGSGLRGVQLGPWAAGFSVAGGPGRYRGWLLCPSPVPAAAGRGLRPRVFSRLMGLRRSSKYRIR
jgi:hypothetical protein